MEQGGWLDQLIMAVLGFLNQPWVTIVVSADTGLAVAYLARAAPPKGARGRAEAREHWAFIKERPSAFLAGAFMIYSALRTAPRLVLPSSHFACEWTTKPPGIPVQECRWVTEGRVGLAYDYTLGQWARDFGTSLLQEAVFGLVGAAVGFLLATIVVRRRRRTAA